MAENLLKWRNLGAGTVQRGRFLLCSGVGVVPNIDNKIQLLS
jgi:hypothetical protein